MANVAEIAVVDLAMDLRAMTSDRMISQLGKREPADMKITTMMGCAVVVILLAGCGEDTADKTASPAAGAAEESIRETEAAAGETTAAARETSESMLDNGKQMAADDMRAVERDDGTAKLMDAAKEAGGEAAQKNKGVVEDMIKEAEGTLLRR